MNYVDFKLSPCHFAQSNSQTKTIAIRNKAFKVFVSEKITHKQKNLKLNIL
jgi:hypothetical protein